MVSQTMNFKKEIASLSEESETRRSEITGTIERAILHFAPGASSLVDVAVYCNGMQIIPDTGYISLDDATVTFTPHHPINLGDAIVVKFINTDEGDADAGFDGAHTITVICELEGVRG
ncbi:MAG: hypothetical protein KAJ24_03205 [Candidatus Aenigmarchaeota archaeon]|nr:hypothetical protein [Candidatus Aenigmarchaeota archaeon]